MECIRSPKRAFPAISLSFSVLFHTSHLSFCLSLSWSPVLLHLWPVWGCVCVCLFTIFSLSLSLLIHRVLLALHLVLPTCVSPCLSFSSVHPLPSVVHFFVRAGCFLVFLRNPVFVVDSTYVWVHGRINLVMDRLTLDIHSADGKTVFTLPLEIFLLIRALLE